VVERYVPIDTEAGILMGRTVFLDRVDYDYRGNSASLIGTLLSTSEQEFAYELTFLGIVSFSITELDFYEYRGKSAFDEIINSKLVDAFKHHDSARKLSPIHRHFRLIAYDDVFEIACLNFSFSIRRGVTASPSLAAGPGG